MGVNAEYMGIINNKHYISHGRYPERKERKRQT